MSVELDVEWNVELNNNLNVELTFGLNDKNLSLSPKIIALSTIISE